MSAFLHQPGHFPGLAPSHSEHQQPIRNPRSGYGPLGRLSRFIRKPIAAVERLREDFSTPYSTSPSLEHDLEDVKPILRLKARSAATYEEWRSAAAELDELEGNNFWKSEVESTEYNFALVQSRLDQLEDARMSCDAERMLFLIRTSLTRHLGDMGNLHLYKHTRIGTKHLIERYINSALETLQSLLDITQRQRGSGLDPRDLLQQVLAARQSFGRSALLLSGGGTFGMNHIGVIKCLWETRLLPRIISGASAGSIVCAVLCTRTDDEVPAVLEQFCYGDLDVFTKTGVDDGVLRQVTRFLKTGALFDISNLTRVMKDLLGDMTFQEAYNRTRRILNICVSSAGLFELPRLLNYVTAPNVIIWSAVAASCSVPFIYSPASLLAKDPKTGDAIPWDPAPQRWIDGSVENDLPMTRLAEMFNVNHFIVSQVNPHVVPFLAKEEDNIALEARESENAVDVGPSWISSLAHLAKDEAMHRMHVCSELGIFPTLLTKTRSILSQRYSGDITIFPEISYSQFPNVLQNPTTDFMLQATLHGERATWPKLSRIQNHCAIELALDDAVQQLRARVAFSPSQVDLRLNTIVRPASRAGSDSARAKSGIGGRKRMRNSTSDVKGYRSFSSSDSDAARPDLFRIGASELPTFTTDQIKPVSQQSPRTRPAPFLLSLNTRDIAISTSETDPPTVPSSPSEASSTAHSSDEGEDYLSSPLGDDDEDVSPPPHPTLWPTTRQLFPHASQPATPSHKLTNPSYFSSATALALTASASTKPPNSLIPTFTKVPPSQNTTTSDPMAYIEDEAAAPPDRPRSVGSGGAGRSLPASASATPVVPLEVDVSGTKGMLLRKRRSMSAGMKGPRPAADGW